MDREERNSLFLKAKLNDTEAIHRLIAYYKPMFTRIIKARGLPFIYFDDYMQEIHLFFIDVIIEKADITREEDIDHFVAKAVKYKTFNIYRTHNKTKKFLEYKDTILVKIKEGNISLKDLQDIDIKEITEKLSDLEAKIFKLYLHKFSYKQIVELLKLKNTRVVDNALYRIKIHLKKHFRILTNKYNKKSLKNYYHYFYIGVRKNFELKLKLDQEAKRLNLSLSKLTEGIIEEHFKRKEEATMQLTEVQETLNTVIKPTGKTCRKCKGEGIYKKQVNEKTIEFTCHRCLGVGKEKTVDY